MQLKAILSIFRQRAFLWCLLLAASIWFINMLGNTYTSTIVIPVELTVDYDSEVWVERPSIKVTATVQAKGSVLMFYKMGLGSPVRVPLSMLTVSRAGANGGGVSGMGNSVKDDYRRRIDANSMTAALGHMQSNMVVMQVVGMGLDVRISQIRSARIAIEPQFTVHCMRQYMQVGEVALSQDSVTVKAPQMVLDTLKAVRTVAVEYNGLRHSVQGSVDLVIPPGVVADVSEVEYTIDVTGFTELVFTVGVMSENVPDSLRCYLVPSQVRVVTNVPLRSLGHVESMREPMAYVNYADRESNLSAMLRVYVDSLSYGMRVKSVEPSFVEPFFQPVVSAYSSAHTTTSANVGSNAGSEAAAKSEWR